MDRDAMAELLMELLWTRSVSGHTRKAVEMVRHRLDRMGLRTRLMNKGGLLGTIDGEGKGAALISAHVDTLGCMVRSIEDDGRLRLRMVGGFTMSSIEGEYCRVETFDGKLYSGTILFDSTSVHAYGRDKASQKREQDKMYVRLDRRVESADDVRALGISAGNYIHLDPRSVLTDDGFVKSRHLDDKAGVAVMAAAASAVMESGRRPPRDIHLLVSAHEEVGHGASAGLPLDAEEFLAVDMGVLGKGLGGSETKVTICAADSSGPFNYALTKRLISLAKSNSIPYVVDTFPYYGSDAVAALRAGMDVRHGLIGPGIDASHAMERGHLEGMEAARDLLVAYMMQTPEED